MSEFQYRYCDVVLPIPVDRVFTYALPPALRSRARPGCRILAPFGSRNLIGVIVHSRNANGEQPAREALKLLDDEPVLDEDLLKLGRWIADYYCAPLGEVLRGMLPLGGEIRRKKTYSLTAMGQDVARQLFVTDFPDTSTEILHLLSERPRTVEYLAGKVKNARPALGTLLKRGLVTLDEQHSERDPLRSPAAKLQIEFARRPEEGIKLGKPERELLSFLELHPGWHNLGELTESLPYASTAARSLARRKLIGLEMEAPRALSGYERPVPELNPHQQEAVDVIGRALDGGQFAVFLLEGVTGSGKTEVYMRGIEAALALGKNALLLVPEIALTPAVAGQFFHRFGDRVAILHSAFNETERAGQWRRIQKGEARVVVGTRSGIFAPVQNLGIIIVDEEHDGSYKQQETPRYHGRDVALVRAKEAGALVVLGSATPSVESRFNVEKGKYVRLSMPERIGNRPMPSVEVIDMRVEFLETKQQATFSRKLREEIERRLSQQEQVMLLLNRRGFSSFMVCRACGERLNCVNCAVSLTFHRRDRRMLCHYCGYAERVPERCPRCDSDHIQFLGSGSERVEDELHLLFPQARVARLDRDSVSTKGAFEHILQSFRAGEIDILVGTQMIAKGHDIANVTLVGVVLADIGLSMPDFRAAERSFQLLTQAAGRAGRGALPGQVIIQTLNPDHYAINLAVDHDYEAFYRKEIEFRKWLRYPPYAVLANVVLRSEKREEALRFSTEFERLLKPAPDGVKVLGPAEAPVPRVRSEYRYQLLLKASKRTVLREVLVQLRAYAAKEKWPVTSMVMDVDPLSLM
jgi:primosomal protein N' (replication factor Y) (superfamily II helicase)